MRLDDAVAFWVERYGADVRPVARVARPSRRVERASLEVQRVTSRQDGAIVAGMALRRTDVADAAVSMIDVVPIDEAHRPNWSSAFTASSSFDACRDCSSCAADLIVTAGWTRSPFARRSHEPRENRLAAPPQVAAPHCHHPSPALR